MSRFTAATFETNPTCERCKNPNFVALVKRCEGFNLYECRKCGPVPQKEAKK